MGNVGRQHVNNLRKASSRTSRNDRLARGGGDQWAWCDLRLLLRTTHEPEGTFVRGPIQGKWKTIPTIRLVGGYVSAKEAHEDPSQLPRESNHHRLIKSPKLGRRDVSWDRIRMPKANGV